MPEKMCKLLSATIFVAVLWCAPALAQEGPPPSTVPPETAPQSESATATQQISKADLKALLMFRDCYLGCTEKIKDAVILRAEGMACMDLCVSESITQITGQGRIRGRVYVKFADGNIKKGLKVPVRLLTLSQVPQDAPPEFKNQRAAVVDLVNRVLKVGKVQGCQNADDYAACGYGMEDVMSRFALIQGFTDIDNGTFSMGGIPEGSYVLWVDWYRPGAQDWNVGNLYRWLIPFVINEQKKIEIDLNETNISYILRDFPRSQYEQ